MEGVAIAWLISVYAQGQFPARDTVDKYLSLRKNHTLVFIL